MAPRKPKVVVTRKLPDAIETRMRELFDTELNLDDTPMGVESLAAAMNRADVLASTITDRIDASLIARAGERLKLIANFGAGVDHIDVEAATERGITVKRYMKPTMARPAPLPLRQQIGTEVDLVIEGLAD